MIRKKKYLFDKYVYLNGKILGNMQKAEQRIKISKVL